MSVIVFLNYFVFVSNIIINVIRIVEYYGQVNLRQSINNTKSVVVLLVFYVLILVKIVVVAWGDVARLMSRH